MSEQFLDGLSDILRQAAETSEGNKGSEKRVLRPSNAGYPMLQQVIDRYISPLFVGEQKTELELAEKRLPSLITVSIGHVFERLMVDLLRLKFPECKLLSQPKMTYKCFTGAADAVLVNHEHKQVLVYECKAANLDTKRKFVEEKVSSDNWGYVTQLSLYHQAAVVDYPDYEVVSSWAVYCIQSRKFFFVPNTHDTKRYADAAVERYHRLSAINELLDIHQWEEAAELALLSDADLMFDKNYSKFGYLTAATPTHFSPVSKVFLDEEGSCLTKEHACARLKVLLELIYKSATPAEFTNQLTYLLEEIDNGGF